MIVDVTESILSFNEALVPIARYLINLNYGLGSDLWDDASESLFDIMIKIPLFDKHSVNIETEYGVRPNLSNLQSEINSTNITVRLALNKAILVGSKSRKKPNSTNFIGGHSNEIQEYYFDSFFHPFQPDTDINNLNFVYGHTYNGKTICAELTDCKFTVETLK